jgi:hypothetical protein
MAPQSQTHLEPGPHGETPRLSDGARTFISLLLFVHLFALALAFLANYDGAELDQKPSLIPRMKSVVQPYLFALWLDRPFQYHLTFGDPMDFDHYLELAITPKGRAGEPTVLRLPEPDAGAGPNENRYRRLAWHVARRNQMTDGRDDLLPIAIGGGVLKQYDAERVQLRCFRKPPLFLDYLDGTAAAPASVNDERLYVADIFFLPGFERPQLNKIGEARDVAPVTRPSATGGQEKIPSGKEDSSKGGAPATPPARNPLLPINPLPRPPNAPSSGESKN